MSTRLEASAQAKTNIFETELKFFVLFVLGLNGVYGNNNHIIGLTFVSYWQQEAGLQSPPKFTVWPNNKYLTPPQFNTAFSNIFAMETLITFIWQKNIKKDKFVSIIKEHPTKTTYNNYKI